MPAFSVEIEIKLRVANAAAGAALLEQNGFRTLTARVFESNTLYDSADGRLRTEGNALRLRQAGSVATLTFKGKADQGLHKSRPEHEVTISDFVAAEQIVFGLGFAAVFRYEKYRTEYARHEEAGLALLDETPIGTFLELEGAADWIDRTAADLGFTAEDYCTDSYAALYVLHCKSKNKKRGDMLFGLGIKTNIAGITS